jgi:hypothetical protein
VFLGLVVALGVRMTPPRGDNWAGCTGLFLGLLVWCRRYQQPQVAWAAIVAGTVGGIAFAGATMAKLVEVTSGLETNWHSILEQTIGFVNGIGIALVLRGLSRKQAPPPGDDGKRTRWVDLFAVFFVTIGITYLNLRKNPALWIRFTAASSEASVFPSFLHGIPSERWFDLAYCLISLAVMVPLILNAKRPIAAIPPSWVGRGQLLLLLLLWWMVVGNFERALLGFHEQRLVTEGVILVNAVALTLLLLLGSPRDRPLEPIPAESGTYALGKAIVVGVVAMTIGVLLDLAIVRAIHGDRFAGHAGYHNRFDPTAKAP